MEALVNRDQCSVSNQLPTVGFRSLCTPVCSDTQTSAGLPSNRVSEEVSTQAVHSQPPSPIHGQLRKALLAPILTFLPLAEDIDSGKIYDVAVVGAGPSGIVSAIEVGFEGLNTILLESNLPPTQTGSDECAGCSDSAIMDSFPSALSTLLNSRKQNLNADIALSRRVIGMDHSGRLRRIEMDGGASISSRALIVATGAQYHRLDLPNSDRFECRGIHYAATGREAAQCLGEDVVIIGGGDSAGQAAVFLSGTARHVHLLVRGDNLESRMSNYLIGRIRHSPHITLHCQTELEHLDGDAVIREVTWRHRPSGDCETHAIGNVFVLIGAKPNSEWLRGHVELDQRGFVRTGFGHRQIANPRFATSCPGVFAVGDVRSGSIKRVASAVSEGLAVATDVLGYLLASGDESS